MDPGWISIWELVSYILAILFLKNLVNGVCQELNGALNEEISYSAELIIFILFLFMTTG